MGSLKAGDRNRTDMTSLEGWGFTIKLRPHKGANEGMIIQTKTDADKGLLKKKTVSFHSVTVDMNPPRRVTGILPACSGYPHRSQIGSKSLMTPEKDRPPAN